MNLNLTRKRVLISGSTKGIGLGLARGFLSEGAKVFINSRNESDVNDILGDLNDNASPVPGDVTKSDDLNRMKERVARDEDGLDVLICNVGSGRSVAAGEEDDREWQRMMDLNLFSSTKLINTFLSLLERGHHPNIICISSICGSRRLGAPTTYSAAKAALNMFVKCQAPFLASKGIRINAISPGNIIFPGSVWETKLNQQREEVEAYLSTQVALGRLGFPEEISDFACFLASERAQFCTGSIYHVDGGQTN